MYNTIKANTSGGCRALINYLDKEESLAEKFVDYLDKERQVESDLFFNGDKRWIVKEEVVRGIDGNCKGLKRDESRFFSLTINPSAREIHHLEGLANAQILEMRNLGIDTVLPANEQQMREVIVKDMLKQYSVSCMDKYAQNFGREGITNNKDLVWFGRVEKDRYWKYTATEVKHNKRIDTKIKTIQKLPVTKERIQQINDLKKEYILESSVRKGGKDIPIKEMMPKSGTNYHIHIVVSRRDVEQKMSLSPLAKARNNPNHEINGKKCKIGFDRNSFTMKMESVFNRSFDYTRYYSETYEGRKMLKENPELYKIKEKEWNQIHFPREEREANINHSVERHVISVGNKVAHKAGLNYINDGVKPQREIISTGYKGIKLLVASPARVAQSRAVGKAATMAFARGAGMASAMNPYMLAAQGIGKLASGLAHGE